MSADEKINIKCPLCGLKLYAYEYEIIFARKLPIRNVKNKKVKNYICDDCVHSLYTAFNIADLKKQYDDVSVKINQHAIGVQNVYKEVCELNKEINELKQKLVKPKKRKVIKK